MEIILTPEMAKAARQKSNLSQGEVAASLGINRTYLSLFESGKYLFDESVLSSLRDYYEEIGYVFESIHDHQPKSESPLHNAQIDEAKAELLLTAYEDNRNKIISLCQQHPKEILFWVDEDDLEGRIKGILLLMAKNYALIEQLRGHQAISPNGEATKNNQRQTIAGYVSDLLSDVGN